MIWKWDDLRASCNESEMISERLAMKVSGDEGEMISEWDESDMIWEWDETENSRLVYLKRMRGQEPLKK